MRQTRHKTFLTLLIASILMLGTSCQSTRTVFLNPSYDEDGKPHKIIRVGPGVKGTIYFWNGEEWIESEEEHVYPEGWLMLPPKPETK